MRYTIHWSVNDGRDGYPNIAADLNWSMQNAQSYYRAIQYHACHKDVYCMAPGLKIKEIGRGKIRNPYRDFEVTYASKKPIHERYPITKTIRVFCQK